MIEMTSDTLCIVTKMRDKIHIMLKSMRSMNKKNNDQNYKIYSHNSQKLYA